MSDKQLKSKAINIKGKAYVLVQDRVLFFNEEYKNGSIATDYELKGDTYHFKAVVTPDSSKPERTFTGHSQATIGDGMVNKAAAMENAETSAVGRALAMMGIGVIESIASADEMNKAIGSKGTPSMKTLSKASLEWIQKTAKIKLGLDNNDDISEFLGVDVTKLPQSKTKGAVDKIEAAAKADKDEPTVITPEMEKKLEEGITLDDIPY